MEINELLNHDNTFKYQMLDRLISDCKYYLGYGGRNPKSLWAKDEKEQIEAMKALYGSFSDEDKPEWTNMEEIESFEKKMLLEKDQKQEIINRIAEIDKEEIKMNEDQWRFGIMVDKVYSSNLFREKQSLLKQLERLERKPSRWQEEYFKDSKCRDEKGNLLQLYHGTGTTIEAFDSSFFGKGLEQYGSGFYFTTDYESAEGYAHERPKDTRTGREVEKFGGEDNPNVVEAYVNLRKPIIIDGKEHASLNHVDLKLTMTQIEHILMRSPNFYLSSDEGNLLGDYLDYYWDKCEYLHNKSDFYPLIKDVANQYFANADLTTLSSAFNGHEAEFLQALNFYTGYDGIIVDFGNASHVIAWFPEQIKSVDNERPLSSKYIQDDLKSRVWSETYKSLMEQIAYFKEKRVPFDMDKQGFVTLYHRTSKDNADKIRETGVFVGKENGLFLTNKVGGEYSLCFGEEVLTFQVPACNLELDDIFGTGEAHFRLPINNKEYRLDVSDMLVRNDKDKEKNTGKKTRTKKKDASRSQAKQMHAVKTDKKAEER